ncbi:MAG TPA: DUF1772 domain-containing protein [Terracidiphilus sp.]|nr:DUF1772 domain-containing protein [Terracidiphilus sp.]
MILIFSVVTILPVGLMTGVEFAVWAFINPILFKLDEHARDEAVRLFGLKLGKVMPFWYVGNFLLLIAECVFLRGQQTIRYLVAASGFWAVAILLSLIVLVPINNRIVRADGTLTPEQLHGQHRKWDAMHRVRVVTLCAAYALLLLGMHF